MGEPETKREIPPGASPRSGTPPPVETRWKKGQSGNPGGRPKGKSIVASLREILEREHNGRRIADLIAERLAKEALAGKFPFLKELMDRMEGPVGKNDRGDQPLVVMMQVPDGPPRAASNDDIRDQMAPTYREANFADIERAAFGLPALREATNDDIRAAALGPAEPGCSAAVPEPRQHHH